MSNGITAASLRGTREVVRERAANTFMCADKLFDGLVLQHMIHVAVDDDVVARAQRSLDMGTIYKSLMALAVHECKLLYSLKNALWWTLNGNLHKKRTKVVTSRDAHFASLCRRFLNLFLEQP